MLFNHPKVLLFLKNQSLQVYLKDQLVDEIKFPKELVSFLEIHSNENFQAFLQEYFTKTDPSFITNNTILALSKKVVFKKQVPFLEDEKMDQEIEKFESFVPLEEQKLAVKKISTEDFLLVLVTNKEIFEAVIEAYEYVGGKIKAVVPVHVYTDLDFTDPLDPEQIKQIAGNGEVIKNSDFLIEDVQDIKKDPSVIDDEGKKEKLKPFPKLYIFGGILLLILISFIIYQMKLYTLVFKENIQKTSSSVVNKEEEKLASNSAILEGQPGITAVEIDQLPKEQVKINVQNGSGVSGQATKIAQSLQSLGYKDISTETIAVNVASSSAVIFNEEIAQKDQEELYNLLLKDIDQISSSSAKEVSGFDVLITIR